MYAAPTLPHITNSGDTFSVLSVEPSKILRLNLKLKYHREKKIYIYIYILGLAIWVIVVQVCLNKGLGQAKSKIRNKYIVRTRVPMHLLNLV